jgi:hypothetical protein
MQNKNKHQVDPAQLKNLSREELIKLLKASEKRAEATEKRVEAALEEIRLLRLQISSQSKQIFIKNIS